ncbi:MAG: cysteine synthase A [Candidatus Treponema excrementipullorum]|nr:cysteine synthase A [Spirochaetia bacterium]MCI7588347.1 cysteine synthase A [Spirochaetia bacterium]MDD7011298.1 cysteine synthase A [Candidatus Treponema excrementipullorum]MDY4466930.1 cysteine synthase A [Candidatus Treponema excrementipullorum]MDY4707759.1 cysteine synthase A [Candidatus Treponema excrementipullorum]
MSRIYGAYEELIGNTPLVELKKISAENNIQGRILAKLEYFNPAGSVKDRIGKYIIDKAEKEGLAPGSLIIEPTSGNTGIGLAALAASRGYKMVVVMPDTMSMERRQLIKAYGAEVVLTPGALGMKGAIEKAEELHRATSGSIIAGQFINQANPTAHYETTGPEIWEDTEGQVDILVAGVGTGGTISGTGAYLKEKNPSLKVIAVEPADSPVLSKSCAGPHKLQGIGAGFIPDTLNQKIYDEVMTVTTEDAYKTAQLIARREGIFVGISSGAALWAALLVGEKSENKNKTIVVVLPDGGGRYLSVPNFIAE